MTQPSPAARNSQPAKARTFNARFNLWLNDVLAKLKVDEVPHIKRIIITVVGGTILIIGAALLFLPGPGLLVIIGGLAVLGTEYAWARRWMRKAKLMGKKALSQTQKILSSKESGSGTPETRSRSADRSKTTTAG